MCHARLAMNISYSSDPGGVFLCVKGLGGRKDQQGCINRTIHDWKAFTQTQAK